MKKEQLLSDRTNTTKNLVLTGMTSAVLAIMAQISIPMPSGVPITLQTFAVAMISVVLLWKRGIAAVVIYILIGAAGLPVFANFNAGMAALAGKTGGFIWGFLFLALFCGIGSRMKHKAFSFCMGMIGLTACHFAGITQFHFISGMGFKESFIFVSFPYLLKDIFSVIIAFVVGWQVRKLLLKASILIQ